MSNYTELISSTAHASNLAYGFEAEMNMVDKVVVEAERLYIISFQHGSTKICMILNRDQYRI